MKKAIAALTGIGMTLYSALPAFAQRAGGDGSSAPEAVNLCPQVQEGSPQNFNVLCNLNPSNALPGILTFILIVAVIIALIYLVWGGIKWITSGGDKGNVETARNQIIAAIIGLIVVFLAWFIINLLLTLFFGAGLTGSDGLVLPTIQF